MTMYWPRDRGYEPKEDFSRERERCEAGNSAPEGAGGSGGSFDLDLFGEIHAVPSPAERPNHRRRPAWSHLQQQRPQAPPAGQEQLEGAVLPFTDPIHARHLARSTPPRIEGRRAGIEAEVDEAFEGLALGGTLADALPSGYADDLTVTRLTDCDIDLREGPILRPFRPIPRPGDIEIAAGAGFWDLLARASAGDQHQVSRDLITVFTRGCAVWWADIRTLFWLTVRREIVDLCRDYFRHHNDILKVVERAEQAAEGISNFALRLQNRAEWDRRVLEEAAARADFNRLLGRYGQHPLYPPHYL